MPADSHRLVLLTGASGYVGGRLLRRLEASPARLRCLTRHPQSLRDRVGPHTEVMQGDVLDRRSLTAALQGVHTACYLIHSMGGTAAFEEIDRRAALNFAEAARLAGVKQIVYLGGLGRDEQLSSHLASRHEVGRLLRDGGVPTVELRASIVIGSGSASFETVRALVDHLPVIVAPRWVETLAQPIAIEDVLDHLMTAIELSRPLDAVYEIGGVDQVTYAELMREYARQRGLHRPLIRLPFLTPRIARMLLGLLRTTYGPVAAAMVESLRNETIVTNVPDAAVFNKAQDGLSSAIARTLVEEDQAFAETRWSDAVAPPRPRWGGNTVGRRLVSSRTLSVTSRPDQAFVPIQRIGGTTGWYAADWFWKVRGLLDNLRGGVGLRRGRRDPQNLRIGDTVDFWRVEQFDSGRLLRLAAEMKIPGRLWLQFEVKATGEKTLVRQTTVFDPAGWVGLAYWYLLYPVHQTVFSRMLRGIQRTVQHRRTSYGTSHEIAA
jgi:uncharacterized protein YbjT (DUF2867 family)